LTTSTEYYPNTDNFGTKGGMLTCTACGSGYYITASGACSACPTNTAAPSAGAWCSQNGYTVAISALGGCAVGYFKNTSTAGVDSCTACPSNC